MSVPRTDAEMDIRKERFLLAFTVVELLVIIAVIIVLAGLLFPAFKGVRDQSKRVQAKNDLTQIVTAVNAFYSDYGVYPISGTADKTVGPGGSPATNESLLNALRGLDTTVNPRQIVFLSPPDVKDKANPRSGIGTHPTNAGQFFDPWGKNYVIRLDGDYDSTVSNPYGNNNGAGADPIRLGVIAWSLGADGSLNLNFAGSDDVISWQ